MLTLECTSGSEALTVVAEDNLTVVYVKSRNKTRFGCFQAPLVLFGQDTESFKFNKLLEINVVSQWLRDCLSRRGSWANKKV